MGFPVIHIPTRAQCLDLMDTFGMLDNIRQHSLVVAVIAELLVDSLGQVIDDQPVPERDLVIAGALLHDIAKTPCLSGSCDHSLTGAAMVRELGYPEVARIVAEHVVLADYDPVRYRSGRFTARELVYYADKRVRHDEIVSLEERLDYILHHYGRNDPARHAYIRENFAQCQELERHLFHRLPLDPALDLLCNG